MEKICRYKRRRTISRGSAPGRTFGVCYMFKKRKLVFLTIDHSRLQVSQLSNDELFKVDVLPNTHKKSLPAKQQKRLNIIQSRPKCFAMLENQSKIPDPIIKR